VNTPPYLFAQVFHSATLHVYLWDHYEVRNGEGPTSGLWFDIWGQGAVQANVESIRYDKAARTVTASGKGLFKYQTPVTYQAVVKKTGSAPWKPGTVEIHVFDEGGAEVMHTEGPLDCQTLNLAFA